MQHRRSLIEVPSSKMESLIETASLKIPVHQLPKLTASYCHNRKWKSQMNWIAQLIPLGCREHLQFRKCPNRNPHWTINKHHLSRGESSRLRNASWPTEICECGVNRNQSSLFLSIKTKRKRLRHLTLQVSIDNMLSSISLMKWTQWCIFITHDDRFKYTSKTNINS